jgi:uncharacterized protein
VSDHIFANHAHVFPPAVRPEGSVERLLRHLDACEIERAVCFAPFAEQVEDVDEHHNRWLAAELAPYADRLIGFGTIDFTRRDFDEQVREIAQLGFKGIKLHPNHQRFDVVSNEAHTVYAAAEVHHLFVSFHTGVHHGRIRHYNVLLFDEVAHYHPRLRFSMEHVGGYHFFTEAMAVIFNNIPFPPDPTRRPRVFGGLTSVFAPDHLRFWHLRREQLLELVAQVGAGQLIFGLDFPYNQEEHTKLAIETINGLGLSDHDRAMILGGTLRRELGLT